MDTGNKGHNATERYLVIRDIGPGVDICGQGDLCGSGAVWRT